MFTPSAGIVRTPLRVTRDLARAFVKGGGQLRLGRSVTGLRVSRGRVGGVQLDTGETISTPIAVNAAGPHSDHVNQMARVTSDMRVRTRPLRHQMHRVWAPPGVDFEQGGCHVSDGDLGINFWPENGKIAVGLEAADAGNLAEVHPDAPSVTTADCFREATNRLVLRVPGAVVTPRRSGWSGLFDVSDDWVAVYDRSCLDGFYLAIGSSGNQFKAAPFVGHLLVELILACESGLDTTRDDSVVSGPRTGETVYLSHYSRLRRTGRGLASLNG